MFAFRKICALAATIAVAGTTGAYAAEPRPAQAWWEHIVYLASDALQGRLPGSPGYDRAAAYVAERFKADGLKPLSRSGFLQPIRLAEQRVLADRSRASLVDSAGEQPLALGDDLILGSRLPQPQAIDAPLVFIGYGLHIPSRGHDDFVGQDLRGKIAVAINGGPAHLSAADKSGARAAATWATLERLGAVGLILLPTPKSMDIPWARQRVLAANAGMYLADPGLQEAGGPRFTATVNPDRAEKLFAKSGHSFAEVLALADAGRPIGGFALNLSLRASVATETRTLISPNIVGVLRGSDPRLAGEYVVVSAHLDHLGVGPEIAGDRIYNGAMDDASGVATVLEVAHALAKTRPRPKRSILFAVFTAEEKGLLGSRAFAENPGVPRGAIVADLNIDMPLPLWPLESLYMPGLEESSLSREALAVAAEHGLAIVPDPFPDRNVFTRTDQFSFVRTGVPAVALKFGFTAGSPQAQIERSWRAERYHAPSDDLAQPVDLQAADRFNAFVKALAAHIADEPSTPVWRPGSLFAPPAPRAEELLTVPLEMPLGRRRQRVLPRYG
jgi:hypothetical protein